MSSASASFASAASSAGSGASQTARRSAYENSRPITAPSCATSFAPPRRSRRAINESCRVVGMMRAAVPPSCSSRVLVSSSTKSGTPSVWATIESTRGQRSTRGKVCDHLANLRGGEPVQGELRVVCQEGPRSPELVPRGMDDQERQVRSLLHQERLQLQRGRIDPMEILHHEDYGLQSRHPEEPGRQ